MTEAFDPSRGIAPASAAPSGGRFIFGAFELDSGSGELRGPQGSLPLTPKAFAVLEQLLLHAGRLLTKHQLLEAVWPDVFVGEGALKTCIREIRQALGDSAAAPRYIATAHRRGYRFVAAVSAAGRAADPAPTDSLPPPRVHYARSGDVSIAYQVVGHGPLDLVFVMGWVSHLEYFWKEPSCARFLARLASFSRLVLLDKRGTGLSDRVAELPTLEQRMDDVRAVLDALGSRRAALLGVSEGGPLCGLFAATYPERVAALVMIGTYAKRLRDPSYPWGTTRAEREAFGEQIVAGWGGPVGIETRAPSRAHDPAFRAWWAAYLRMGASPGAALGLTRMNAEIDARPVLPTIRVPTLVLHRSGDRCLSVEEGRFVASLVPGARFVEVPGEDHLPFVGDQEALLAPIEEFLGGLDEQERGDGDRLLATVLCGRWGPPAATTASAAQEAELERRVRQEVPRFRGSSVSFAPRRFSALFDGPARAVRCARRLVELGLELRVPLRAGLHTGECARLGSAADSLAGEAASRLAALASVGEVWVSRTVVDLVAGSGLRFVELPPELGARLPESWATAFRVLPMTADGTCTGGEADPHADLHAACGAVR